MPKNTQKRNKKERKTDKWGHVHCKRFARMTYLENIAKRDITQFVVDDIPGNTLTTGKKLRNNAKRKSLYQHPQTVVAINN